MQWWLNRAAQEWQTPPTESHARNPLDSCFSWPSLATRTEWVSIGFPRSQQLEDNFHSFHFVYPLNPKKIIQSSLPPLWSWISLHKFTAFMSTSWSCAKHLLFRQNVIQMNSKSKINHLGIENLVTDFPLPDGVSAILLCEGMNLQIICTQGSPAWVDRWHVPCHVGGFVTHEVCVWEVGPDGSYA